VVYDLRVPGFGLGVLVAFGGGEGEVAGLWGRERESAVSGIAERSGVCGYGLELCFAVLGLR